MKALTNAAFFKAKRNQSKVLGERLLESGMVVGGCGGDVHPNERSGAQKVPLHPSSPLKSSYQGIFRELFLEEQSHSRGIIVASQRCA